MSDRIELLGLRVLGTHGALAFEQEQPQPFELDLEIETDFAKAKLSDDLADTIDYGKVVTDVSSLVKERRYALLESLAEAIAELVLLDARVVTVVVRLKKLRPSVPVDLLSAGVVIARHRPR